jgi:hypothetical protein
MDRVFQKKIFTLSGPGPNQCWVGTQFGRLELRTRVGRVSIF